MMLIEGMDFVIRLWPCHCDFNGAVRLDSEGRANIYINPDLSPQAKKRALAHELRHLLRNDLYSPLPTAVIERQVRSDRRPISSVFDRDGFPIRLTC